MKRYGLIAKPLSLLAHFITILMYNILPERTNIYLKYIFLVGKLPPPTCLCLISKIDICPANSSVILHPLKPTNTIIFFSLHGDHATVCILQNLASKEVSTYSSSET